MPQSQPRTTYPMMAALPLKTPRTCSQCGNNGHNARTCTEPAAGTTATTNAGFMLFGVRLTAEGSPSSSSSSSSSAFFRKSMSMNNLSQYEHQPLDSSGINADVGASGYVSDDALHASGSRTRERKRGVPWTEEEHKLFLMGLKKVGKGDWRGISRNFVKTRTPTQVASHAQKYFLRRTNANRRRRRSSLFDITTDTVTSSFIEDSSTNQDPMVQTKPPPPSSNQTISTPSKPMLPTPGVKQTRLVLPISPSSKIANLNLNQSPSTSSTSTHSSRDRDSDSFLSLKLSAETSNDQESVSRASSFGGFNSNGDSIISVA